MKKFFQNVFSCEKNADGLWYKKVQQIPVFRSFPTTSPRFQSQELHPFHPRQILGSVPFYWSMQPLLQPSKFPTFIPILEFFSWLTFVKLFAGSATEIPERFTFVNIAKNWTAAQAHCKNLSTDLAIVRNQQENEELQKLVEGGPAWIGLTREYRHWMDRTVATFIPWDSSMPLPDDKCGYLQTQSKPFKLKSTHCGVQMGFFCYSGKSVFSLRKYLWLGFL